jgi:protein glucosyltransferase
MLDQIQEDLAPFKKNGVNSYLLKQFVQQASSHHLLVHIRIYQGKVFSYSPAAVIHTDIESRLNSVHQFFQVLAKDYKLPNVEFVLTLHDGISTKEMDSSLPLFTFAKNKYSPVILIPDFEALLGCNELLKICDNASVAYPWKMKKKVIFWRGATTGGIFEIANYLRFPRAKLVFLSKQYPQWLDAAFTALVQATPEVYDFILANTRPLARHVPIEDHFAYKYLIDVDGNSCTYSRCRWILLSNSVLVKPGSENIQWYYKALKPWIHYVPIQSDFQDLADQYKWLTQNDTAALRIAKQGQTLGKLIFSKLEIDRYVVTLLNEYSKILVYPP